MKFNVRDVVYVYDTWSMAERSQSHRISMWRWDRLWRGWWSSISMQPENSNKQWTL